MDLSLNNLQLLMCHKTNNGWWAIKPNQIKPNKLSIMIDRNEAMLIYKYKI